MAEMRCYPIRSLLFNTAFLCVTVFCCVCFIPFLFAPKRFILTPVKLYLRMVQWTEEHVLGLKLELRGLEHLPETGSYIVAAKHQSTCETLKLHLLFDHPAIVLKKELLDLPLWGKFLQKSDVIAIDRSDASSALSSLKDGIQSAKDQHRPVVVFPQGTRVPATTQPDNKPYKTGIARIYEAAEDLSVIPMAINTGHFWPKSSGQRRPGTMVFEFLPPIQPGLERKEFMHQLRESIETHSAALVREAQKTKQQASKQAEASKSHGFFAWLLIAFALFIGVYAGIWLSAAENLKQRYESALEPYSGILRTPVNPSVSGFPANLTLTQDKESLETVTGSLQINNLRLSIALSPGFPLHAQTDALIFFDRTQQHILRFDSFLADLQIKDEEVVVHDAVLKKDISKAYFSGVIHTENGALQDFDISASLENYEALLNDLLKEEIINQRGFSLASNALKVFEKDGRVRVKLRLRDNVLYAGPIPILTLPDITIDDINRLPPTPAEKP